MWNFSAGSKSPQYIKSENSSHLHATGHNKSNHTTKGMPGPQRHLCKALLVFKNKHLDVSLHALSMQRRRPPALPALNIVGSILKSEEKRENLGVADDSESNICCRSLSGFWPRSTLLYIKEGLSKTNLSYKKTRSQVTSSIVSVWILIISIHPSQMTRPHLLQSAILFDSLGTPFFRKRTSITMGSRMNPDRKIYIGGLPNDANKYSSPSPPFSLKCFVGRFGFVQLGPFYKSLSRFSLKFLN